MISVIIPTRDKYKNLFLTLKGLEYQTFKDFEVIVVDNGDDDTYRVSQLWHLDLTYIKYKPGDDWNASVPRNKGAKLAKYDYLLFLDADVVLNKDALANYIEDINKNPDRVIVGPYDWLPPVDEVEIENLQHFVPNKQSLDRLGKDLRQPSFEKATSPDLTFDTVYDGLACFGGNLLVPKKIFWKAGGYDESMRYGVEDGDFGITLWELGVKFSYDVRCIGWHQYHPIGLNRSQGAPAEVRKLNIKHNMDVVYASGKAYRRWGIDWHPGIEYFDNKQELMDEYFKNMEKKDE